MTDDVTRAINFTEASEGVPLEVEELEDGSLRFTMTIHEEWAMTLTPDNAIWLMGWLVGNHEDWLLDYIRGNLDALIESPAKRQQLLQLRHDLEAHILV